MNTAVASSAPARVGARELVRLVQDIVRAADRGTPRSRQRMPGPSDLGHACDRYLTYVTYGMEPVNTGRDPWPAIVGTAVHAWLADAFTADNARLGRTRWLIEERVTVTDALAGRADLYDTDSGTVIDHKVVGAEAMRQAKTHGPSAQYRTQVHLYGYGHVRAGRAVDQVAIVYYPRSGWLDRVHVWAEPYDEQVALAALDRLGWLVSIAGVLDVETNPDRWALIPARPGPLCVYCPFFRPGRSADATGCPGHPIWTT